MFAIDTIIAVQSEQSTLAPPPSVRIQTRTPSFFSFGRQVKKILDADIAESEECLIVTGFTSLAQIIETFGVDWQTEKKVCILLGVEPLVKVRRRWKEVPLSQEVKEYWLDKGISPFQSGAVIKVIQHIEEGRLSFKILDKLHAKLYITEHYATLGSSNFSQSGLTIQHEANIRMAANDPPLHSYQYEATKQIAEYYWQRGKPYSTEMISLLRELLIVVDWQEALARAISELLEGSYVKAYLKTFEGATNAHLWPSQAMGINDGVQVLQQMGSLLVADPTGSGKTKMITVMQLAMINWLWETGRGLNINPVVITPPLVIASWKKEQLNLGRVITDPVSQGILSLPDTEKYQIALETLKLADLLIIDEAHNFLNRHSARSISMSAHRAEYIILSTATPINKKAEDLLRLVQLLDPDNLGDEELNQFKELYSKPPRDLEENQRVVQQLKSYIWRFTVRRTKDDLNRLIRKQPEKYLNELGKRCHYPEQEHLFYDTVEDETDIRIAEQIEALTSNLKGLIYLRTIAVPKNRNFDTREQRNNYIQARLNTAKGLSRYRVQAALRSSRAALVELVEGTQAAESHFSVPSIGKETGKITATLESMSVKKPNYPKVWDVLPDWLSDDQLFKIACDEEVRTYKQISRLAKAMSDKREQAKASQLRKIIATHSLVVAFDHTIITLFYLQNLINRTGNTVYVVSGGNTSAKQQVLNDFRLGSDAKSIIALCSDAVSEGVNLQAAPAVVMLDMPSVLRLAEQRIGRIDRLNSPHKRIHIYWPSDSKMFQLRADRNLIRTAHITKQLVGSNLNLPDEQFLNRYEDLEFMSAETVVEELRKDREEQENEWAGIKDAFSEVRQLIDGEEALLQEAEYLKMRDLNVTVRCKLSFVKSPQHWAFVAVRGSKEAVSRWIFIDEEEHVHTDFTVICKLLRQRLQDSEKVGFDEAELKYFIGLFRQKERETLPQKKRRALKVAESILSRQRKEKSNDESLNQAIFEALELFKPGPGEFAIDYNRFSTLWLEILTPWLQEWRQVNRQRKWISLENLEATRPKKYSFTESQLRNILSKVPLTDPLELQIAACIVGVGQQ